MNEACIKECPQGFEPSDDYVTCIKIKPPTPPKNTTIPEPPTPAPKTPVTPIQNNTNIDQIFRQNFESKNYIPIPITIVAFFFGVSVYMSKKSYPKTFVAGCLVALISVFEFIS